MPKKSFIFRDLRSLQIFCVFAWILGRDILRRLSHPGVFPRKSASQPPALPSSSAPSPFPPEVVYTSSEKSTLCFGFVSEKRTRIMVMVPNILYMYIHFFLIDLFIYISYMHANIQWLFDKISFLLWQVWNLLGPENCPSHLGVSCQCSATCVVISLP